eukprot:CAMPEP_0182439850 /NCGR_PEP_ID=MMETSP1167-20130531/86693_1 /TAXON_ID=2988 /ORGANISM="Mallomonas Sp, Strain CCMP3275" /LENGTH=182 /DNA_ID=CAMNT_0024633649 /DNA_START=1337 /DNA_END=1885 /DNA_ORIENTATION=-
MIESKEHMKSMETVLMSQDEYDLWINILPSLCERCRVGWTHRSDCIAGDMTGDTRHDICPCGLGQGLEGTEFHRMYGCTGITSQFRRAALSPMFPVLDQFKLHRESLPPPPSTSILANRSQAQSQLPSKPRKVKPENKCGACGGYGVNLMRCSGCKNVWYCSASCQKKHWTAHKKMCKKKKS